jgi:hypothetical protein
MNNVDLAKKEIELCSIAAGTDGLMEYKDKVLREKRVYEEYKNVHSCYSQLADKDIESLKRGLFIQWYAVIEPAYISGIFELDHTATHKIFRIVENRVLGNNLDFEFKWMLTYYFNWEYAFSEFMAFRTVENWIRHNETEMPDKIDRNEMSKRGQMGRYWNSLNQFAE